jgi:hypothetical protein
MAKEKILFFDSGPIISLVMSRLGWILPELKKKFNGKFYITPAVKYELVDRPITIRRFEFEALEVMKLLREGILEVYDKIPGKQVRLLTNLANSSFKANGKKIDVMQKGEMEAVACALQEKAGLVIDERTLRIYIEDSKNMEKLLERRFKHDVKSDKNKMLQFNKMVKNVPIIRSIELASVAYKLGILNSYIPKIRNGKNFLVDGILWSTKYNGCAVTEHEIEEIKIFLLYGSRKSFK